MTGLVELCLGSIMS